MVSISAGLAKCGKKAYAVSPACFLSARSYEQCKIDVAYSNTNVKLIGISGGVSYGSLGLTHHSLHDIAAMCAIPNMRVYIPSDHIQTKYVMQALLEDKKPAYIRVGRNPVEPIYDNDYNSFELDKAVAIFQDQDPEVLLVACGELVHAAKKASEILRDSGIRVMLLDMYCLKPLDNAAIINGASKAKLAVTIEEHSPYGGLGALVAQTVSANCPTKVLSLSLPDAPVISGSTREIFDHYGLNPEGIVKSVLSAL